MPDILVSDDLWSTIIRCGTCGTEWEYLRDQIQCPKCMRMPNMKVLRNTPISSTPIVIPIFCDDCRALKQYWSHCTDCPRES